MNELLLHPTTDYQLRALVQAKPHAVLISGNKGTGKQTVAEKLIGNILGKPMAQNQYVLKIEPENASIGIEAIRQIRDFLSRKTTGSDEIRRIVLILESHCMTNEAQNALLKSLEGPPADTMVLMTTDDITALRHTIRSRSQQIHVLPVSEQDASGYFKSNDMDEIKTAYYISDGRVGLLSSLLAESSDHELVTAITDAKAILKMSTYDRLLRVESLSKQKDQVMLLLNGLERVVISGLRQSAQKQNTPSVKKFHSISKKIAQAVSSLKKNANTKLVLTDLFLKIG